MLKTKEKRKFKLEKIKLKNGAGKPGNLKI